MAWNVEIDAPEFFTLSEAEHAQVEDEIARHAILVWESAKKMSTTIYGGGDNPPPMLAELDARSRASREDDA